MKKLLLFSDLHCNLDSARKMVEIVDEHDIDILVGAGDFGVMRNRIGDVFNVLHEVDKPAVIVPGNAESVEELTTASAGWSSAHVLHGNGVTVDGVSFFGIGGGIPITPFGAWSYDFSEEIAQLMLDRCEACDVLVTHSPPKGAVDLSSRGMSLGSVEIRAAVERLRPRLVVCGHIHDSSGQQTTIGETVVINAGWDGVVFNY